MHLSYIKVCIYYKNNINIQLSFVYIPFDVKIKAYMDLIKCQRSNKVIQYDLPETDKSEKAEEETNDGDDDTHIGNVGQCAGMD